jgi:hypothetical protein
MLPDTVAIASARWKVGDFRVTGGGTLVGAIVTVRSGSLAGPVLDSAAVTAGPPRLSLRTSGSRRILTMFLLCGKRSAECQDDAPLRRTIGGYPCTRDTTEGE